MSPVLTSACSYFSFSFSITTPLSYLSFTLLISLVLPLIYLSFPFSISLSPAFFLLPPPSSPPPLPLSLYLSLSLSLSFILHDGVRSPVFDSRRDKHGPSSRVHEISPRKIAPFVRNKTRTKRDDVTKIGQKTCVPGRPPRLKVWYPLPFCLAASRLWFT